MKHFRYYFEILGEVIEVDVAIIRPDRGETLPGDDDTNWGQVRKGPRVVAVRMLMPAAALRRAE